MENQDRERPLSPKQIEQRRAAARQARGPRTPLGGDGASTNALRHGRYAGKLMAHAATLARSMEEIGEDPEEFSALHQGIIDSFHPSTLAEETLVREIARLHWERQRLERAQEALIARRVQQLEIDRQRKSLEISRKISSQLPLAQGVIGYLWTEESPEKYQKLLDLLDQLKQMAALGMYQGAGSVLKLIYGEMPNARGVMIRHFFETLVAAGLKSRPEAQEESETEDSSESTGTAENTAQESPSLQSRPAPQCYAVSLRRESPASATNIFFIRGNTWI